MLALSRKEGERIRLTLTDGSQIWLTLLEIRRGGAAVIGIDCPRDIKIEREEIIPKEGVAVDDRNQRENSR